MAGKQGKRAFGQITRLPSGRIRARYTGPDLIRHNAPYTFETQEDAGEWLAAERRIVTSGAWVAPKDREKMKAAPVTFGEYATAWLADRTLKPRTRVLYTGLLVHQIAPTFAETPLKAITPRIVREWHHGLDHTKPTQRAHAYGLLKAILSTAVSEDEIPSNPCRVRGAGQNKRAKTIRPATLGELEILVAAMPAQWRSMTLLAAWCGLRFGELVELRRKDLDLKTGLLHVHRAVVQVDGESIVSTPKSEAGLRDVTIPPHLIPVLREHRDQHAAWGPEGLLFPAADGTSHLAGSTLWRGFAKARVTAGRPDLRFHDLRHTGAVLAAQTGATLRELMGRLGHSTPGAALRYQHAAEGRDVILARNLSALAASQP